MRFFFFKQKTAYEMRISDWSSDVCSSDLLLQDEAVREHRIVGRASARSRGFEQRRVEPAAMLVGAFEVEVGRPLQLRARLQHEGVRRAGIEPYFDHVGDLLEVFGAVVVAEEALRIAGEPGIAALLLEGIGDALDHLGIRSEEHTSELQSLMRISY